MINQTDDKAGRQGRAVAAGAVYLLICILLVFILHGLGEIEAALLATLVFAPLLVYAIASGAVSQISGPGGWGVVFRQVANQPVQKTVETREIKVVRKGPIDVLQRQTDDLRPGQAVAVSFVIGAPGAPQLMGYTYFDVRDYLKKLMRVDPHLTIVMVDAENELVATSDGLSMEALVDLDSNLDNLLMAMEQGELAEIRSYIPVTTRWLTRGDSNAEALRIMLEDNVHSLVVVDEQQRPVGVVRRDEIVSRLVSAMAQAVRV